MVQYFQNVGTAAAEACGAPESHFLQGPHGIDTLCTVGLDPSNPGLNLASKARLQTLRLL